MHDKCRITWLSDILITQCISVTKTVISTNTSFDDTARKVLHEKCPCADRCMFIDPYSNICIRALDKEEHTT